MHLCRTVRTKDSSRLLYHTVYFLLLTVHASSAHATPSFPNSDKGEAGVPWSVLSRRPSPAPLSLTGGVSSEKGLPAVFRRTAATDTAGPASNAGPADGLVHEVFSGVMPVLDGLMSSLSGAGSSRTTPPMTRPSQGYRATWSWRWRGKHERPRASGTGATGTSSGIEEGRGSAWPEALALHSSLHGHARGGSEREHAAGERRGLQGHRVDPVAHAPVEEPCNLGLSASLSQMTPPMMTASQKARTGVRTSSKKTGPKTAAPTAPIPAHTA